MSDTQRDATTTSTGHAASAAGYLDAHFAAARPEYEAMLRMVGLRRGWRLLDAGAGGGSFLPLMAELAGPSGRIVALDLAPENVAAIAARVAAGDFECSVEAHTGGIDALAYPDDSFDAVWCANVLQYLDDARAARALAEFRRVVRPGGLVAVKEQDPTAEQTRPIEPTMIWRLFAALAEGDVQFAGQFRSVDLRGWLERAGLADVWQRTTLVERWSPLRHAEREYLADGLAIVADLALRLPLPAADRATWERLADPVSRATFLDRPDLYFREAHVLAVGRVPGAVA
jgi:ubiquinone/menaquinone biosynthesis C-methylase UbiE